MTSGETSTVAIAQIQVNRSDRIRKELNPKRVEELAESIGRIGLIHFPVVTREFLLVSGETRVRACEALGWDRVPVQWADELTDSQHLEIEFEENVKRSDLSWQDQCDALRRYHELKKAAAPDWRIVDTAESIGVSQATAINYLAVAAAIQQGDQRVISAPKRSTAIGLVRRATERQRADELDTIRSIESPEAKLLEHPFLNEDFLTWAPQYSGPPFNLVNCDFPYGIGADGFNQGAAASFGGYKDDFDTYSKLIECLIENRERLLGTSAHIIFWFSMKFYDYTLRRLRKDFWIDPYPLIWHKSDNKGTLPDPERGPRRIYEVAFLCSWGDRKIVSAKANLFSAPTVRTGDHMSEKSEVMLAHFFSMLVDENTRLLDPTAGSGSALRAARGLGVNHMLGIERDNEFFLNAVRAWHASV